MAFETIDLQLLILAVVSAGARRLLFVGVKGLSLDEISNLISTCTHPARGGHALPLVAAVSTPCPANQVFEILLRCGFVLSLRRSLLLLARCITFDSCNVFSHLWDACSRNACRREQSTFYGLHCSFALATPARL